MTSKNRTTGVEISSIRYRPQQRDGGSVHTVSVDPVDGVMTCTCKAGEYGRECWAQKNAKAGKAGKPIIRGHWRESLQRPTVHRARTSEAGRDLASMLDV